MFLRHMVLAVIIIPASAEAVRFDAALDPTYGDAGRAVVGFVESTGVRLGAYVRSPNSESTWMFGDDAKDVSALYIARIRPDGVPDETFGPANDGRRRILLPEELTFNTEALSLSGAVVQSDGRPIVFGALEQHAAETGRFPGVVCRLNLDGSLDGSFGTGGCHILRALLSTTERCRVTDVALDQDGYAIAVGNCSASDLPEQPILARLTPAGSLDLEFGGGAGLLTPPMPNQVNAHRYQATAALSTGQIVIVGDVTRVIADTALRDIGVWKVDNNGTPDPTFDSDGFALLAFDLGGGDNIKISRDVAVRADSRILVLGEATAPDPDHRVALLAQLLQDGELDKSFGDVGQHVEEFHAEVGPASFFNSLELDARGRAVVGGARITGFPDAVPSAGTDFWFAFPRGAPPETAVRLFIASDIATSGVVENLDLGVSMPFTTSPGAVTTVIVDLDVQVLLDNDAITYNALHVSAESPVVVQAVSGKLFNAGGFTALPTEALGKRYRIVSWDNGLGTGSQFSVVAAEPGLTEVTIVTTATAGGHDAGVPFTISLLQGQAYHLWRNDAGDDLTGTTLTSDKRISVVAANSCAYVPNELIEFCDLVSEQLVPTSRWGKQFAIVPFAGRQSGDIIRIVADESDTIVSIGGVVAATLDAGKKIDVSRSEATIIQATRPVAVAQFAKGCKSDIDDVEDSCRGDPAMLTVPPSTAWSRDFLAVVPENPIADNGATYEHYLTIVAPTGELEGIEINGVGLLAEIFTTIGGTAYAYARLPREAGVNRVTAKIPVAVSVYGFNEAEAYSYPAAVVPLVANRPASDDLVVRFHVNGELDDSLAPDGVVKVDHGSFLGAPESSRDGVVRALPYQEGVLVGSAVENILTDQSLLMGYRLIDTLLFRDGFED